MASKGATPIAIRAALLRFDDNATLKSRAAYLLRTVGDAHDLRPELDARLPVPHPLDFDWRFSSGTAETLAIQALAHVGNRAPILLVGVPSVLLAICDRPNRPTIWFASRGADPITTALKRSVAPGIKFIDIEEGLGAIEAAVSVVDPPWYDDIAQWMVAKAASGTSRDGEVWVAGPDALTGLSSAPKLSHLDIDPFSFGLRHAQISGLLRYDTPPFEMLALKRNGILNVPPTWRTGRLYCGTRLDHIQAPLAASTEGWEEHGTERARIWTRPCESGIPFQIAHSLGLSRLDPERARAAFWTSGHRYSFGRPEVRYKDAFRQVCATETAIVDDLVVWKGRFDVQKDSTAFHVGAD